MPRVSKGTRVNVDTKPKNLPKRFKAGFLKELDKRTGVFKILKERFDTIAVDLGGQGELSHMKRALVERFCWLECCIQDLELRMANGEMELLGKWVHATNSLIGLAKTLGLERATSSPWLLDVASTNTDQGEPDGQD